jgi:hypothetical protein
MHPTSPEALLRAYDAFAKVDRLQRPVIDFGLFPGTQMPQALAAKMRPKLSPMERSGDYEAFDAEGDAGEQAMPALLGLVDRMVTSLTVPESENIFAAHNLFDVFTNALTATNVHTQ